MEVADAARVWSDEERVDGRAQLAEAVCDRKDVPRRVGLALAVLLLHLGLLLLDLLVLAQRNELI